MIQADVVCGREVDENTAQQSGLTVELHGRVYYFCSEQCLGEFERNPEHFTRPGTVIAPDTEKSEPESPPPAPL